MLTLIVLAILSSPTIFSMLVPSTSNLSVGYSNLAMNSSNATAQLEKDANNVFFRIGTLTDEANNFPERTPSLSEGLKFEELFAAANEALIKMCKDIKAIGYIPLEEARALLSHAESAEAIVDSAMLVFIDKKDALKTYPVELGVATTEQDLITLCQSTMCVYDEFIYATNDTIACETVLMKKRVYQLFQGAIDQYAD
ncbi:hypothetical protein ONZ45_g8749 [Pleurotus djamor]|nr:hypothetical protein ONZ45_g8749 [Pleurotus djamor]